MNSSTFPRLQAPRRSARRQAGLTLVECGISTLLLAVTTGIVAPSLQGTAQRVQLRAAAGQLETDLQFARSSAAAMNRGVRISFSAAEGASCYVVHTGSAQQCVCAAAADAAPVCTGNAQALRSVHMPASGALQLRANVGSVLFDPARGTSTPTATMRLTTARGDSVNLVMNILGRVRSCNAGSSALPDLKAC